MSVDGFVVPVPKTNLAADRQLARRAGEVWREHGAIDDRINAKVMTDPRLADLMKIDALPFDGRRMIFGGFKTMLTA